MLPIKSSVEISQFADRRNEWKSVGPSEIQFCSFAWGNLSMLSVDLCPWNTAALSCDALKQTVADTYGERLVAVYGWK